MSPAVAWGLLGVAVFSLAVWWSERDPDRHERGAGGGAESRRSGDDVYRWSGYRADGDDKRG